VIPTINRELAITLIIISFVVVATLLLGVLVASVIRQQRRYLRTRQHLGGRLLTAQDEERAAIARELHDDSVQRLIACAARLRAVDTAAAVVVADDLDQVVHDLRGLARGIHPAIVDHVGLDAALADLSASFVEREGVRVEYAGPEVPDELTPVQRLALYRVAQEALGNVARHANVDCAWVRLSCDPKHTRLVIKDRGNGFDRRTADSGPGIGITSMRERLAILGGTLDVESSPGSGTQITATLPRTTDPK
jgi:signal transduction histidine kinase